MALEPPFRDEASLLADRFVRRWLLACASLLLGISLCLEATAAEGAATSVAGTTDAGEAPVASAVTAPGAVSRLSFAVIIGNNKSLGKRRPELHYADDDAARYFEIFQTMAPGRVSLLAELDRDSQRLFPEARLNAAAPTRRNLRAVGEQLAVQVRAARAAGYETEVYFVFAGHGDVERGEGFIEMADARLRSNELVAWLRAIPFHQAHVILDSCNSFFMLGARKPGGRHFATSEDAARAMASRLANVGVFLSTSAEGEAFEWSEIQSGIFSHVVRSGLLGGADSNGDGSVSYLELAAFVDTATADVTNPNMRPHVFARGPGARDQAPIARLHSMTSVRRFDLRDASSVRLRMRDAHGIPLFDAHTEQGRPLLVALPESWARGALLERTRGDTPALDGGSRQLYTVPEPPGIVTLSALQTIDARSAVRGPDETFHSLFSRPFGPSALLAYASARGNRPPPVYGVSQENVQRMQLVLEQLSRSERGKRLAEGLGGLGFGALMAAAGIGVLHVDDDASSSDRTEAHVLGGVLLGVGGLFVIGGGTSTLIETKGERAAAEFRRTIDAGGDPTQAFAAADRHIQELAKKRRAERLAGAFVGSIVVLGSVTGLVLSEVTADPGESRMAPRLGWSGGVLAGGLMVGDALLMQTTIDSLAKIWRDDPSLNQYQPSVTLSRDGASLGLTGSF